MAAPADNKHYCKWNQKGLLFRVCMFLLSGSSKTDAFKRVGINPDTGFLWLRQGREQHNETLAKFERVAERCVAHFNAKQIEMINGAAQSGAPNTWQAAAWMLERRDPENWGRRDKTTITHEDERPLVQLNQVVLVDSGARNEARALLERIASPGAYKSLGVGVRREPEDEAIDVGGVSEQVDPR